MRIRKQNRKQRITIGLEIKHLEIKGVTFDHTPSTNLGILRFPPTHLAKVCLFSDVQLELETLMDTSLVYGALH